MYETYSYCYPVRGGIPLVHTAAQYRSSTNCHAVSQGDRSCAPACAMTGSQHPDYCPDYWCNTRSIPILCAYGTSSGSIVCTCMSQSSLGRSSASPSSVTETRTGRRRSTCQLGAEDHYDSAQQTPGSAFYFGHSQRPFRFISALITYYYTQCRRPSRRQCACNERTQQAATNVSFRAILGGTWQRLRPLLQWDWHILRFPGRRARRRLLT